MDDRDEPGRIEIELTSHEPSRPSAGRDSDDQLVAEAVDSDPGPLGTERGRLIAVGSAAAVFALLLGVVLGRAGSGGDHGSATPVSSDAPTTSVDDALTTIEPPEPVETAPPTTARRRVTTTTLVEPSTGSIEVAALVADQPIEVIAAVAGDEVVVIDPTTGTTSALNAGSRQFGGPESIRAGAGWIMVPSYDGGSQSTLYLDDGTSRSVETGPGWSMRGLHGSDYFWRLDEQGFFPSTAVEYRYDGTATGREIEVPDNPAAIDPLGGFAVFSSGGVYLVDKERTERITTGRLLALGAERAVVHECDELLRCSHIVVDRSNGVRRPLDIVGLAPGVRIDSNAWFPVEEPLAPSETAIVVMTWNESSNGSPNYGVVDLLTGQYTEIGSSGYINGMRWTPDGRFVFWLRGGSLEVFDPLTGESVKLSDDLGFVNSFAIRPALPSVDPGEVTSITTSVSTPATTAATTTDG